VSADCRLGLFKAGYASKLWLEGLYVRYRPSARTKRFCSFVGTHGKMWMTAVTLQGNADGIRKCDHCGLWSSGHAYAEGIMCFTQEQWCYASGAPLLPLCWQHSVLAHTSAHLATPPLLSTPHTDTGCTHKPSAQPSVNMRELRHAGCTFAHFDGLAVTFANYSSTLSHVSCTFTGNNVRSGVVRKAFGSTAVVTLEKCTFTKNTHTHNPDNVYYAPLFNGNTNRLCNFSAKPEFYSNSELKVSYYKSASPSLSEPPPVLTSQPLIELPPGSGILTAEDPFFIGLRQVCTIKTDMHNIGTRLSKVAEPA
jgi:hypothetical protein